MLDPVQLRLIVGGVLVVAVVAFAVAMEHKKFQKRRQRDMEEKEKRRVGAWFGDVR